jgi:hypothetical protein
MRPFPSLVAIVAAGLLSSSVLARRNPSPGGAVTVAVPRAMQPAFVDVHANISLLHIDSATDNHREGGPVSGVVGYSSLALSRVDRVEPDAKRWSLQPRAGVPQLLSSLQRCLVSNDSWPRQVLTAAQVRIDISGNDQRAVLSFSKPVAVLPLLLTGCSLVGDKGASTGPFAQSAPLRLVQRKGGGLVAAPLLATIDVVEPSPGEVVADVALVTESPQDESVLLLAPSPAVVMLLQPESMRAADPLRISSDEELLEFRQQLRADLLAAVFGQGRAAQSTALLPSALAPARLMAEPTMGSAEPPPLALQALPANAPRVTLVADRSDAVLAAVVDRLALLLRSRGLLLDVRSSEEGASDALRLVRFTPAVADAALALLAVAGSQSSFDPGDQAGAALLDGALLSADADQRLGAALDLERALLGSRTAIALLSIDTTIAVSPRLHGVRLRIDGVPLMADAWWGQSP